MLDYETAIRGLRSSRRNNLRDPPLGLRFFFTYETYWSTDYELGFVELQRDFILMSYNNQNCEPFARVVGSIDNPLPIRLPFRFD